MFGCDYMIKIEETVGVYPPSEDSFLLLEATKYACGTVLDLFAGSGVVGLTAASRAKKVTLADVNEKSIRSIKRNAELNGIKNYEAIKSNFFSRIPKKKFDVIYMNPPYLRGEPLGSDELDAATLGGKHGYDVTLEAIKGLKSHLRPGGVAFLILSTVYDIEKVYKLMDSINLKFSIIDSKKFFFEELILIKIYEKRRHSSGK